jgi:hypothetical protein
MRRGKLPAATRPQADTACSRHISPVRRQHRDQVNGSEKKCSARSARTRRTERAGNGAKDRGAGYGTVGDLQAKCGGVDCSGVSVKHSTSPIAASDRDESSTRKCLRIWSAEPVTEVAGMEPPRFSSVLVNPFVCSAFPLCQMPTIVRDLSLVRCILEVDASPEKFWHSSTVLILL